MTTPPKSRELTASVEDYLKTIYSVDPRGGVATTLEIAQRLGVAPASVSGMLRRLGERGFVQYERYRGATLTKAGMRTALHAVRRHRVLEAYLSRVLGFPWDQIHDEAERLEHAASDALIERMAHVLGEPAVDPHGAPIPTRDGTVDATVYRHLGELTVGERARVERVSGKSPEMLRHLDELGLRPGAVVSVSSYAPFGELITIETGGGAAKSIGLRLATEVLVTSVH